MARIMAIDYGSKRTGLAVTDPLQIIASGLTTVNTHDLIPFLKQYIAAEPVEKIIIGQPTRLDGSDTHVSEAIRKFIKSLNKHFPAIPVVGVDERFTSKLATRAMLDMGLKKKERRNKALVDEIAATMMLQEFMGFQDF